MSVALLKDAIEVNGTVFEVKDKVVVTLAVKQGTSSTSVTLAKGAIANVTLQTVQIGQTVLQKSQIDTPSVTITRP